MVGLEEIESAIARVQDGDRESFSIVVEVFHVRIRAFIGAFVHDPFDADDVAQQAFITAYAHIREYELGTNFAGWLKAIAYNHIREQRTYRKRTENSQRKLRDAICQHTFEVLDTGHVGDELEALDKCVENLPNQHRELLKAAASRSSTLDELARDLNRSGAAVRKTLSRLYKVLRVCVEHKTEMNRITP